MSTEILEYVLRATVIWSVLLAYYFICLRQVRFGFQRTYLLGSWLFGLSVPLLPGFAGVSPLPELSLPVIEVAPLVLPDMGSPAVATSSWGIGDWVVLIYLTGVLLFGARTLVQAWRLQQWIKTGTISTIDGFRVVRHPAISGPFAACGYIFLPAEMADNALTNTALIHEAAHLRARHHYDNILLTLNGILCWFHPLTWVHRRLLATVHEYEADAAVIRQVPVRIYGLQLLQSSLGPAGRMGLFSSPLQQRITMITNFQQRPLRVLPLLLLICLLGGLVVACSDAIDEVPLPTTENIRGLELLAFDPETEFHIDEYPKPVGTSEAATKETLLRSIYQQIKYPQEARLRGETGFIRVAVNISEKGTVTNVTVIGLSPEEDENPNDNVVVIGHSETGIKHPVIKAKPFVSEVERLFNAMAPYTPAKKDGTAIPVSLTFDFKFDLE